MEINVFKIKASIIEHIKTPAIAAGFLASIWLISELLKCNFGWFEPLILVVIAVLTIYKLIETKSEYFIPNYSVGAGVDNRVFVTNMSGKAIKGVCKIYASNSCSHEVQITVPEDRKWDIHGHINEKILFGTGMVSIHITFYCKPSEVNLYATVYSQKTLKGARIDEKL